MSTDQKIISNETVLGLKTVSMLMEQATKEVESALQARDIAEWNYQAQRRNTLAFCEDNKRLRDILKDILHADARGQGLPFAEAMARAVLELTPEERKAIL